MNEHEIAQEAMGQGWDWKALAIGLVTVLTGLLAWVGNKQVDRIDVHDGRLDNLEDTTARKDDLTKLRTEIKSDISEMEGRVQAAISTGLSHVAERVGDVRSESAAAHKRIDDMMRAR